MANRKIELTDNELREMIRVTVHDTLTHIGVQHSEPLEMQKDFQHLRDWRESTEGVKRKGMMTLVAIFVTSAVAIFVLGIKEYFNG